MISSSRRSVSDLSYAFPACRGLPRLTRSATLHSPLLPLTPGLPYSQSDLGDVVGAHVRRALMVVADVDKSFSTTPDGLANLLQNSSLADLGSPISPSLLDIFTPKLMGKSPATRARTVSTTSDMPTSPAASVRPDLVPTFMKAPQSRHGSKSRRLYDSGIGSSIESLSVAKLDATSSPALLSAISLSAAASSTVTMDQIRGLSNRAINRIYEHTLNPLRAVPKFKPFEPILMKLPRRLRVKEIVCLRDVEKTLFFMAPERAKDNPALCLEFCRASIRCVQATVKFLKDNEQTRPGDRPYTNGYFLDLEQQLKQYAHQLSSEPKPAFPCHERKANLDHSTELDATDEIRLFGGVTKNGRPVELIRVKRDGRAFSLATGEQVDIDPDTDSTSSPRIKRSLSEEAEDQEEIIRSMARRKKGALAEVPVLKQCSQCEKTFARQCDRHKHEKSHMRSHKCPHVSCKYHDLGWPTEKELVRHLNDRHSSNPEMFKCLFECPYKSKRESNCKQHMEKAHGWVYQRTKSTVGAHTGKTMALSPKNTASLQNSVSPMDTTSTQDSPSPIGILTPVSNELVGAQTPHEHSAHDLFGPLPTTSDVDYPSYPLDQDFVQGGGTYDFSLPLTSEEMDFDIDALREHVFDLPRSDDVAPYGSTFHDTEDFIVDGDIYAASAHMPTGPTLLAGNSYFANNQLTPNNYLLNPVLSTLPLWSTSQLLAMQSSPGQFLEASIPDIASATPGSGSDAMLYTHASQREIDDFLEEVSRMPVFAPSGHAIDLNLVNHDFVLFPTALESSVANIGSLEIDENSPSAGLGFSPQVSQGDLFPTLPPEAVHPLGWQDDGQFHSYLAHEGLP